MQLPESLLNQISDAWAKLDKDVVLAFIHDGNHEKRDDFRAFLTRLAGLSERVVLREETKSGEKMRVEIHLRDNDKNVEIAAGIAFQGIPLGHELTSFVLAPLAAAGVAKMPDEVTVRRIRALKGPVALVTYASLTCENCPVTVQALNMIAALNPSVTHTMVEGGLFPEEVQQLGIQSVPTVRANGEDFHTGRAELGALLDKLEERFGADPLDLSRETKDFDVVVVGGGPAGATAAIYAARKGLRTAIVAESIGGQVNETRGIENLIGTPYTEGPKLASDLKRHLAEYPVTLLENQRAVKIEEDSVKTLFLKSGLKVTAKAVVLAAGAKWRELGVPGEKEYLGRGVAFCPHCDGPFYKGRDVAVIGGGNSGVEAALDLAGICKSVTVVEFADTLKADRVLLDKLEEAPNISVIKGARTARINGDGTKVTGLTFEDRASQEERDLAVDGIFVQIGLVPSSRWLDGFVETTRFGEIVVDERGRTNRPGVFAAGDVTTVPYKQIVVALGEGAKAGLAAFEYLLKEV